MIAILISLAPFLMGLGSGVVWALLRERGVRADHDETIVRMEAVIVLLSEALIEGKPARMEGPAPVEARCPCGARLTIERRWS